MVQTTRTLALISVLTALQVIVGSLLSIFKTKGSDGNGSLQRNFCQPEVATS